jgi:hypothetical protein
MTAIHGTTPQPVDDERPIELGTENARQGMTTGHIRWVLVISTFLAAVAFIAVWMSMPKPHTLPSTTGAAATPASAPGPTSSNPAAQ